MPEIIEGISHLDVIELKELLSNPDHPAIVIDVREHEEYAEAHIQGLPLIPMGDIIDIVDRLDSDKEYVFVCRSGRRSLEVAKFFQNNGFRKVHNFKGGMLSWQEAGLETASGLEHVIESFHDLKQLERKRAQ